MLSACAKDSTKTRLPRTRNKSGISLEEFIANATQNKYFTQQEIKTLKTALAGM